MRQLADVLMLRDHFVTEDGALFVLLYGQNQGHWIKGHQFELRRYDLERGVLEDWNSFFVETSQPMCTVSAGLALIERKLINLETMRCIYTFSVRQRVLTFSAALQSHVCYDGLYTITVFKKLDWGTGITLPNVLKVPHIDWFAAAVVSGFSPYAIFAYNENKEQGSFDVLFINLEDGELNDYTFFSSFFGDEDGHRYSFFSPPSMCYARQHKEHLYVVTVKGTAAEFHQIGRPEPEHNTHSLVRDYNTRPTVLRLAPMSDTTFAALIMTDTEYIVSIFGNSDHERDVVLGDSLSETPYEIAMLPGGIFFCAIDTSSCNMWVICKDTGRKAQITPKQVKKFGGWPYAIFPTFDPNTFRFGFVTFESSPCSTRLQIAILRM